MARVTAESKPTTRERLIRAAAERSARDEHVQHWGSGGTWPALDDVPQLVVDAFRDGAAPRPARASRRAAPSTRPRRRRPDPRGARGRR